MKHKKSDLNFVTFREIGFEESGMTRDHFESSKDFCQANKFPTIFRPINPEAAPRLDDNYIGKKLSLKLKSSNFGPISGDIPRKISLGKSAGDEKKIEELNRNVESEFARIEDRYKEITKTVGESKPVISVDEQVHLLTSDPLIKPINKKVIYNNNEYDLRCAVNKSGEVILDQENRPIFMIESNSGTDNASQKEVLFYNYETKSYELVVPSELSSENNYCYDIVEIMAYRCFEKGDDGSLKEVKPRPITADYDILTTGASRRFALEHDSEGLELFAKGMPKSYEELYQKYSIPIVEDSREDFKAFVKNNLCDDLGSQLPKGIDLEEKLLDDLAEDSLHDQSMIVKYNLYKETGVSKYNPHNAESAKYDHHIIAAYELQKTKERSSIISQSINGHDDLMGHVSAEQSALVVHLRYETREAVSHGPEINNPTPEDLLDGTYVAFDAEGKAYALNNQRELCKFINMQRAAGFGLEVNPKWGWELDENNELFVPESRLNWRGLEEKLKELTSLLQPQEKIANYVIESQLHIVNNLSEFMQSRLEFERIKTEPPLVYEDSEEIYESKAVQIITKEIKENDLNIKELRGEVQSVYKKNWQARLDLQFSKLNAAFDKIKEDQQYFESIMENMKKDFDTQSKLCKSIEKTTSEKTFTEFVKTGGVSSGNSR